MTTALISPQATATVPTPEQIEAPLQVPPELLEKRLQLLGSITWLMFHSPLYRSYTIETLEERVLPSLMHDQFRYYEIQGQPVGFLNWCWLSAEIEAQFESGNYRLSPNEWKSGDRLWFPEFIAPLGHTRFMVKDVRQNIFARHTPAKAIRVNADGTFRSIAHYTL